LTRGVFRAHDGLAMKSALSQYGTMVACGILLALSFPSAHWYPLAWLALAPVFFHACRSRSVLGAFWRFFLAGWVFYSLLLQWLISNIYWAGGWAVWGYQILCVIMALYWGLYGAVWFWIRRRVTPWLSGLSAAILWAAMEALQSRLFTGFGWGALAYSQGRDMAFLQLASLGGCALIGGVLAFVNASLGAAAAERRLRVARVMGAAAVVLAAHGLGWLLIDEADYAAKPLRAGVLQSSFPLEMKWDPEYTVEMVRNACEKSRLLARYEDVDLMVWPEALVMDPLDESTDLLALITGLTQEAGCPLFTGSARTDAQTGQPRNSAFLVNGEGAIEGYYDKVHLAPYGEYTPLAQYVPFLRRVVPSVGDMEPGDTLRVFSVGGRQFGPLICFEVLFSELAESLRKQGADFLVVITNLGWFGHSNAIPQEIDIARLRAVETRLPVVHCANTGMSGVLDPWGRFEAATTMFDHAGRCIQFQDIDPRVMVARRCAGAFNVASPGRRWVPRGPELFPWFACGMSVVLAIWAALAPRAPLGTARVSRNKK